MHPFLHRQCSNSWHDFDSSKYAATQLFPLSSPSQMALAFFNPRPLIPIVGLVANAYDMLLECCLKKPWISEPTLNIIEDRRAARLRGDKPKVKRLTMERNRALGLDQGRIPGRYWDAKAAAIESAVARQDQHTVFRELRTCKLGLHNQSTTVQAEDGRRLANIKD